MLYTGNNVVRVFALISLSYPTFQYDPKHVLFITSSDKEHCACLAVEFYAIEC
jgi:hypothetical protein